IRLDGVADPRGRQSGPQLAQVCPYLIEIDGEIRCLGHRSQSSTRCRQAVPGGPAYPAGCVGTEKCSDGTVGLLGGCVDSDVVMPSTTSVTSPVSRSKFKVPCWKFWVIRSG